MATSNSVSTPVGAPMIETDVLQRILGAALKTGGDFAEVFGEDRINASALREIYPEVKSLGAELVAITPELERFNAELATTVGAEFPVLSDMDNGYALLLNLAFLFASTNEKFCPTLKAKLGSESAVPDGVTSIMEIIINGRDLDTVARATYAAIQQAAPTEGLVRISAGNYGGRLGKSFIYLRPKT